MKGITTVILVIIIGGLTIGIGYLMCVGLTSLIFWALQMGGVNIDFSIWIGGAILYILWVLLGEK